MSGGRVYSDEAIRAWMDGDDVFCVEVRPGTDFTVYHARHAREVAVEITDGREHFHIIDLKGARSVERDAREHFSKTKTGAKLNTLAVAIIVNSPLSKVIANFFIGFNRPQRPVRIFNTREEALKWFNEFRDLKDRDSVRGKTIC